MKLARRNLSWLFNIAGIVTMSISPACGLDDITDKFIDIRIISNFSLPSYISDSESCNDSWFEPLSANFTLKSVKMSIIDIETGNRELLDLLSDGSTSYRITNRTQKIFSKKISESELNVDLIGKVIEGLRITFIDEIEAQTKLNSSLTTILGSQPLDTSDTCTYEEISPCLDDDLAGECSIVYAQPIDVKQAQGYSFLIGVNWKRTVERDSSSSPPSDIKMISPSLDLSLTRT